MGNSALGLQPPEWLKGEAQGAIPVQRRCFLAIMNARLGDSFGVSFEAAERLGAKGETFRS
jgi:hypothetical protein